MNVLFILLLFSYGKDALCISKQIADEVIRYFNDESVLSFSEKWEVHRPSAENALELAIKETFGKAGLNTYLKSIDESHAVSDGYLISDSIVNVLFKDMNLTRFPYLRNPRVWFPLASNVLRVEAFVSKMIINSDYRLFRNHTDVVSPADKDEESKSSPFSREQVQDMGQATIIAEQCLLHGDTVATLQGLTVNLGYDNFELDNCKFTVELSSPGIGSPPLIMPYFSETQGLQLSRILMRTLIDELMTKLQAAVHSHVNTTMVFGNLLPIFRQRQRDIFRKTNDYEMEVIRNLNKITILKNVASDEWKDYKIVWTEKKASKTTTNVISLNNMTVYGLDSGFTGRTGGPVKTDTLKIYEDLRFHELQLRGSGLINIDGKVNTFQFSTEIEDIICKTTLIISNNQDPVDGAPVRTKSLPKEVQTLWVAGWRKLEIFGPPSPIIDTYSWITGFLLNRIPELIARHLSRNFKAAVKYTEKPFEIKQSLMKATDQSEENQYSDSDDNKGEEKLATNAKTEVADPEKNRKPMFGGGYMDALSSGAEKAETESDGTSKNSEDSVGHSENSREMEKKPDKFFKEKFFSTGEEAGTADYSEEDEHETKLRKRNIKVSKRLHKKAHMSDNEIKSE